MQVLAALHQAGLLTNVVSWFNHTTFAWSTLVLLDPSGKESTGWHVDDLSAVNVVVALRHEHRDGRVVCSPSWSHLFRLSSPSGGVIDHTVLRLILWAPPVAMLKDAVTSHYGTRCYGIIGVIMMAHQNDCAHDTWIA